MQDFLIYWMLFIAIAAGFLLGRYSRKAPLRMVNGAGDKTSPISPEYIRGLNHLLNEDADAAVDTFTELLPVNDKTLDTHLALGALLRRRGEVGRAIRVHQHLVEHQGLERLEREKAQLELGLDYLKAGVLDRAEDIFERLQTSSNLEVSIKSLGFLAEIYRDEKEWLNAAAAIESLLRKKPRSHEQKWRAMQSHFYYEEAQSAQAGGDLAQARKLLAKASAADGKCVRVSLLMAGMELQREDYKSAIRCLKRVPDQDPDYIPEILPGLLQSYQALGGIEEMIVYLKRLQDEHPSSSVIISLAELVNHHESEGAAVDLLNQKLDSRPSLRVVGKFLDFHLSKKSKGEGNKEQALIRNMLESLLEHKSYYCCGSCGFSVNQLHWQCPSCKSWGSIKAVKGLEGE